MAMTGRPRRCLGVLLAEVNTGTTDPAAEDIVLMVANAGLYDVEFVLPAGSTFERWCCAVTSAGPIEPEHSFSTLVVASRSIYVLVPAR